MHKFETQRLKIRLLNTEDYKLLYPLHSDPEVMKFIREPDQSLEQTKKRMDELLEHNKEHPELGIFLAYEKESDELIGWLLFIYAEMDKAKDIEIGYRLFPKFWNKGYATEMTKMMINHAFSELAIKKICGVTRPDNLASRRVLEKSGLKYIDEREFYNIDCSYYEVKND